MDASPHVCIPVEFEPTYPGCSAQYPTPSTTGFGSSAAYKAAVGAGLPQYTATALLQSDPSYLSSSFAPNSTFYSSYNQLSNCNDDRGNNTNTQVFSNSTDPANGTEYVMSEACALTPQNDNAVASNALASNAPTATNANRGKPSAMTGRVVMIVAAVAVAVAAALLVGALVSLLRHIAITRRGPDGKFILAPTPVIAGSVDPNGSYASSSAYPIAPTVAVPMPPSQPSLRASDPTTNLSSESTARREQASLQQQQQQSQQQQQRQQQQVSYLVPPAANINKAPVPRKPEPQQHDVAGNTVTPTNDVAINQQQLRPPLPTQEPAANQRYQQQQQQQQQKSKLQPHSQPHSSTSDIALLTSRGMTVPAGSIALPPMPRPRATARDPFDLVAKAVEVPDRNNSLGANRPNLSNGVESAFLPEGPIVGGAGSGSASMQTIGGRSTGVGGTMGGSAFGASAVKWNDSLSASSRDAEARALLSEPWFVPPIDHAAEPSTDVGAGTVTGADDILARDGWNGRVERGLFLVKGETSVPGRGSSVLPAFDGAAVALDQRDIGVAGPRVVKRGPRPSASAWLESDLFDAEAEANSVILTAGSDYAPVRARPARSKWGMPPSIRDRLDPLPPVDALGPHDLSAAAASGMIGFDESGIVAASGGREAFVDPVALSRGEMPRGLSSDEAFARYPHLPLYAR